VIVLALYLTSPWRDAAMAQRLCHMRAPGTVAGIEIGQGARNPQHAVITAHRDL
jgi:hypothetical protein